MKRLLLTLVVVCAGLFAQGCLVAPVIPPYGIIFSDLQAPLDYDSNATIVSTRSGESTSTSILGLIATGDASLNSAARNGNLSVIHYADYKYTNIVGVIQTYTTVVYGE